MAWHPTKSHMLLLGFAVGVFPMVAWQIIRSIMSKIFRYALPSLESQLALNRLDGLTVWHEARLEEEDIENVPNMATADIVSLLISTRLPADRIVDWVDQAILLTYLGPDQASNSDLNSARNTLACHGVRTASALLSTARSMQVRGEFGAFATVIEDKSGRAVIHVAAVVDSDKQQPLPRLALAWNGRRGGRSARKNQLQLAPLPLRSGEHIDLIAARQVGVSHVGCVVQSTSLVRPA